MRPRRDLMTTLRFLSVAFVFLLTGPPLSAAVQKAPGKKTATATAAPQPVSKVAPASALKALSGGEPADLIVEFSDTSVRRMAADLRASAGVALDTREIVEWKAAQYAAIKVAAMETISEGDIETLRDYSHLPMTFLRVRSRAAFDRLMASREVVGVYADQTHRKLLSESRPLIGQPMAPRALINVNFPALDTASVRGIRVCRQGFRDYGRLHVVERTDPRGYDYYWFGLGPMVETPGHLTDLEAVADNFVSVTPLHLDLTHEESLLPLARQFDL